MVIGSIGSTYEQGRAFPVREDAAPPTSDAGCQLWLNRPREPLLSVPVVATSTLDLGIDWGDVDLVVHVGSPKGASRLAQRIGRAINEGAVQLYSGFKYIIALPACSLIEPNAGGLNIFMRTGKEVGIG